MRDAGDGSSPHGGGAPEARASGSGDRVSSGGDRVNSGTQRAQAVSALTSGLRGRSSTSGGGGGGGATSSADGTDGAGGDVDAGQDASKSALARTTSNAKRIQITSALSASLKHTSMNQSDVRGVAEEDRAASNAPVPVPPRVVKAELLSTLEDAQSAPLRTLAVSTDGLLLFSGGEDRGFRVWSVNGGAFGLLCNVADAHTGWVWTMCADPAGPRLFTGSADCTIRVWDIAGVGSNRVGAGAPCPPKLRHTLRGHEQSVCSLVASSDGSFLYSGSDDGNVKVWNVSRGLAAPPSLLQTLSGHTGYVASMTLSADSRTLFSAGMNGDTSIRMWRVCGLRGTGERPPPTAAPLAVLSAHTAGVYTVTLSPDGKLLYSGGEDKNIMVWRVDMEAGAAAVVRIVEGAHERWVRSLRITRDGRTLFSGSADTTIGVWDVTTAGDADGAVKLLQVLRRHTDRVRSVRISRDGRYLFSGSADRTIRCWQLK